MSDNILDKKVLDLFTKVKAKQKAIAAAEKPKWATSCTFGTNPDVVTDRINLQTVMDVNKLVDMYGFLLMKKDYHSEALNELGCTNISFKWMGFTLAEWTADFISRFAQINVSKEKAQLKEWESRLDSLITVEQRRAMELAELEKEIQ